MVRDTLRSLRDESRPAGAPARTRSDVALSAVVLVATGVGALASDGAVVVPAAVGVVVAAGLLWRRSNPLAAVLVVFGTLAAFDVARVAGLDAAPLASIAASLLLPYALLRWGSGREAAVGLGAVLAWLAVTHVADPTGVAEQVAGYAFFLLAAALGAATRFRVAARRRDIERARLWQRTEIARDLHDAVGHHVSAIAIQAQAGRAVAVTDPGAAVDVLSTIEQAATRTLTEMRAMVGILRDGAGAPLTASGSSEVRSLGRAAGADGPSVVVRVAPGFDDVAPSIRAAVLRIAQEAVTNALRHAHGATTVDVDVRGSTTSVGLTVRDDGSGRPGRDATGYGLLGMRERTALLGGTLQAGRDRRGGWTVSASFPRDDGGSRDTTSRGPVRA